MKQMRGMADLSDAQWEYLRPFVKWEQEQRQRPDGRGGRWSDARRVLNGVLWILHTGARWQDLPTRYEPYQPCQRRFQQWVRSGELDGILWELCEVCFANVQSDGPHHLLHLPALQPGMENPHAPGFYTSGLTHLPCYPVR